MTDVHHALHRYSETLLRRVADNLVKARTKLDPSELIERCFAALENAALIDRRIRDLSDGPRAVLAAIARSRQPNWKAGHLITLAAALGHAEGFTTVAELLSAGLLYPADSALPIADFDSWFAASGGLHASCSVPQSVANRAAASPLPVPALPSQHATVPFRHSDGLDWPLRLAAARQRVEADPVRMTRTGSLYKKDQSRFEVDPVLSMPNVPDGGVVSLFWSVTAGLLAREGESLTGDVPFPAIWDGRFDELIPGLFAAFFQIESWDPLSGLVPENGQTSAVPTAALLTLLLLAAVPPDQTLSSRTIAEWLWEHHSSWPSIIPPDAAKSHGSTWVDAIIRIVFEPLSLVEVGGESLRLSPLGRHILAGSALPPAAPPFPHTLLVQPNAELLVYRQGLTPVLIATLSRFAEWKVIGPACTLELNERRVYRGLESGLTVAEILQVLQKHGSRAVPPSVVDLLKRWGSKRERVSVFPSATLVEFTVPADLDEAIARGVVSIKLTDRIGLTADGRDPDYASLRLIGNRDYEARPQPCVRIDSDGITWTIDASLADLLLDAELGRFTDPLVSDSPIPRRVRANPEKIRRAVERGLSREDLDQWFVVRTGEPTPNAIVLFAFGPDQPPPRATREIVIRFASVEAVDGAMQWPDTQRLILERIGPSAVTVAEESLPEFVRVLSEVGISVGLDWEANK